MTDAPKKRAKARPKAKVQTATETPAHNTAGTALEAYKWKPGQSGNPGGRPRVVGELRDLARAYTVEGLETLASIMRDANAPPAARVAAVGHILDRGYGKPTQHVSATVQNIKQMSDDELLAYITGAAAVEADSSEGAAETPVH